MANPSRDYKREVLHENQVQDAHRRWIQARVDAIHKGVSAHDVLRRNGINLRYNDREEQFSCPFHGVDRHPSARVYPETVKGPSHVWCFTCHENWDVFRLWAKFSGGEQKFTRVLVELERAFGITPPERPPTPADLADQTDPESLEVEILFTTCENRLRRSRSSFEMKAHMTLGSILDRLLYQFEHGSMRTEEIKKVLHQILEKIGSKERARK